MFGYACRETDVLMPLPITVAHRLAQQLARVRKDGTLPWVRPDGKTQVTAVYEDGRPVAIDTIVVSTQHSPEVSNADIHDGIAEHVIEPVLARFDVDHAGYKKHINPTGRFVVGGPQGDCGLTGRKIIVDTYGGSACHGGGAFSGKDPTKVDRSAAYAARHLARNIVAAGLAERCQVQVAYAIGVAEPVSIHVDTFGTGKVGDARITEAVRKVADMTPRGIIARLRPARADLPPHGGLRPLRPGRRPVQLGAGGHGGGPAPRRRLSRPPAGATGPEQSEGRPARGGLRASGPVPQVS